jgi:hypothetical protein
MDKVPTSRKGREKWGTRRGPGPSARANRSLGMTEHEGPEVLEAADSAAVKDAAGPESRGRLSLRV